MPCCRQACPTVSLGSPVCTEQLQPAATSHALASCTAVRSPTPYAANQLKGCMQGCTALHMAAHSGHAKAAACLAKAGACDVDAVDSTGRTALHHAAAQGHDAVVQALWARGCSVQAEDVEGWTGAAALCLPDPPADYAACYPAQSAAVQQLPVVGTAQRKQPACCRACLTAGLGADTWHVHAALHHAAQAGHTEVVAKLVIAGAPVQHVDVKGRTAAHLAAVWGGHEIIEKMLNAGFEVDSLGGDCLGSSLLAQQHFHAPGGPEGSSVLHIAAYHGHFEVLHNALLLPCRACCRLPRYHAHLASPCKAEGHGCLLQSWEMHCADARASAPCAHPPLPSAAGGTTPDRGG